VKNRLTSCCFALAVACTYNEYKTINEGPALLDAGQVGSVRGQGGSRAGQGGRAGTAVAGAAAENGGTGGGSQQASACRGCARVSAPSKLQLSFGSAQSLRNTVVTFRVRVGGGSNAVFLTPSASSGGAEGESLTFNSVRLEPNSDWQDVGFDLNAVDAFRAPTFLEAGAGGSGFDPGVPFDKANIIAIGISMQPDVQAGVFTSSIIEMDVIRFSDKPALDVDFSNGAGGLELVDSPGASLSIAGP
jgi:hypothetical protein